MATIHGVAGEWARVKGTVGGLWPLFLGIFATGFSAALLIIVPLWGAVALVLSLMFISWSLVKGMRRVESFFKGARGEEMVSGILRELPDAYHVFNDFLACGKHVDHVVVGPAGVFAVETKFWRGKVTVEEGHVLLNGQLPDRSPLQQALNEAELVRAELKRKGWEGLVAPVLVFASNNLEARIVELQGVVALNASHLRSSFCTERVVIPPFELDRLVRLMENNS